MNRDRKNGGFTLIELLVAIALFSIIVSVAVGGFVNALRTQRQITSLISAQSNAGLAIEQAAREIRTGYLFCDQPGNTAGASLVDPACAGTNPATNLPDCSIAGNGDLMTCDLLAFFNAQGIHVKYSLVNGVLMRQEDGGAEEAITSPDVTVDTLSFTIFGNQEGDHWNPRITMSMGVSPNSTDPAVKSDVTNIQTTISARSIDCLAGPTSSC